MGVDSEVEKQVSGLRWDRGSGGDRNGLFIHSKVLEQTTEVLMYVDLAACIKALLCTKIIRCWSSLLSTSRPKQNGFPSVDSEQHYLPLVGAQTGMDKPPTRERVGPTSQVELRAGPLSLLRCLLFSCHQANRRAFLHSESQSWDAVVCCYKPLIV